MPLGRAVSDKDATATSNGTVDSKITTEGKSTPDAKRAKSPSDDKQDHPAASTSTGAAVATASGTRAAISSSDGNASGSIEPEQEAGWTVQKAVQAVVTLMKDKDVKVAQRAATAAGHLCSGQPVKAVLEPALEGLFALGFNKNEDVLFTVGEALCFAFGGKHLGYVADCQTVVMSCISIAGLCVVCHCAIGQDVTSKSFPYSNLQWRGLSAFVLFSVLTDMLQKPRLQLCCDHGESALTTRPYCIKVLFTHQHSAQLIIHH